MITRCLFTLVSVALAACYWLFEVVIHVTVFDEPELEFIPSDIDELWTRCFIVILIVAFGAFADNRKGAEKHDVYEAMLGAINHILNNFLQKMYVFRDEAENSEDFDKNLLTLYDQMIDETSNQIRNLENIQGPNRDIIEERYWPKEG